MRMILSIRLSLFSIIVGYLTLHPAYHTVGLLLAAGFLQVLAVALEGL